MSNRATQYDRTQVLKKTSNINALDLKLFMVYMIYLVFFSSAFRRPRPPFGSGNGSRGAVELEQVDYALCTMHYALCTMHYALCTMHYARGL